MILEDLIGLYPFIVGLVGVVIVLILFYMLYWKPRIELPLEGERLIGIVSMWLPRGFGVLQGPMTTARTTMQHYWADMIQNEHDANLQKIYRDNRDFMLKFHMFAIRSEAEKKILLFDVNPEDQKFMDVDKEGVFHLHGIQDARSVGKWGDFEYFGLKLNPETLNFSKIEVDAIQVALMNTKFLSDAARNTGKISSLQEVIDSKERELTLERKEKAEMRSKLDRALSALSQRPLTQREEPQLKGGLRERLSKWGFTWWQLATAGLAYFIAPQIIKWSNVSFEEPELTYLVLGIALLGFFSIPIVRKVFGRWL